MIKPAESYQGLQFKRAYLGHREGSVATTVPYGVAVELVRRGFATMDVEQPKRRTKKRRSTDEEE